MQPENYNILYFIKLTSMHQRILVYCANSDDLGLQVSHFTLVINPNSEVHRLTACAVTTHYSASHTPDCGAILNVLFKPNRYFRPKIAQSTITHFYEFLRILKPPVTNSRTMQHSTRWLPISLSHKPASHNL